MPEQYYHSEPDALHTSRRDTLARCPRRFYIEYVLGLERIGRNAEGLRMGDGHAVGLEHSDPAAVLSVVYQPLIEVATNEHTVKSLCEEARKVALYVELYLGLYPEPVEREIIWDLPIPGSTYRNCGTMDFMLTRNGRNYAGEDKLYAQWGESNEAALDLDDQVTGEIYSMAAQSLNPAGCKYRVTKKASIKQRMIKQPETFDEYMERLREKLEDNKSDHFLEFTLTRTVEELIEFQEELLFAGEYIDWMTEREADGKPSFPRTPKTCSYFGGCAHSSICLKYPNWESGYRKKGERVHHNPPKQLTIQEEVI